MSDTAKAYGVGWAPKRIDLFGDVEKKPESAQHIITFPGGAIELSRTSNNEYWAHIVVNRSGQANLTDNFSSARGEIVDSRIGRGRGGVEELSNLGDIEQIAVRIRVSREPQESASERQPDLFGGAE